MKIIEQIDCYIWNRKTIQFLVNFFVSYFASVNLTHFECDNELWKIKMNYWRFNGVPERSHFVYVSGALVLYIVTAHIY